MKTFRADLHIHTVLSPCGDLDMSPRNIIEIAKQKKLDIIGITDHNSTLNCAVTAQLGNKNDILVLQGVEITTKEEVHCLAFFEKNEELHSFQQFLEKHYTPVENDPTRFGYQVVVDENDLITREIENLLIVGLNLGIDTIAEKVKSLQGIFIPAHIDRSVNSIYSQLGFWPTGLQADAVELSKYGKKQIMLSKYQELEHFSFIQSSDAHFTDDIGKVFANFEIENKSFSEIRLALQSAEGRSVSID
jgi:3',5'-nucleoside bisphosphate phosphatase